jgi:16S rRNA (guanine527-N7)-methyltransferase
MSISKDRELTDQEILSALMPFGIVPAPAGTESIRRYISLLLEWNQKISLTGLSDPAEIASRHFGESLFVTKLVGLETGRLADVGSGAGFPGLALKVLCPGLEITLVEQSKKKSAFLAEVVRALSLEGVSVFATAYEDWSVPRASLDFVTARAIGQYPRFLKWAAPVLKPGGKAILWLGDEESNHLQSKSGWSWNLPVRIPLSLRRQVLIGSPSIPDVAELLCSGRP